MKVFSSGGDPESIAMLLVLDDREVALVVRTHTNVDNEFDPNLSMKEVKEEDILASLTVDADISHIVGSIDSNGNPFAVVATQQM